MPKFDIALRYHAGLPDGYLDIIRDALPHSDFEVFEDEFQPQPYGAMEWVIPTAIAVYIAKPFIDAIIKRAADDFADVVYPRLKAGVTNFVKKLYIRERLPIKVIQSGEVQDAPNASIFSLYSETVTRVRVKFVFDKSLTEEAYDGCVERAFSLLLEHHQSDSGNDELSRQIGLLREDRRDQIFLVYNEQTGIWEARDPIQESIDKQRGSKSSS